MGFRSTFTTEDMPIEWTPWFVDKYNSTINFPEKAGAISSKFEQKTYGTWQELDLDIQKVLKEQTSSLEVLELVYLHECGGITKVEIYKDKIIYGEPSGWEIVDQVTHDYCYDCSKLLVE